MTKKPHYWNKAIKVLSKKDKIMRGLILKYPDKTLTTRKDLFYSLCKSIIGQQISVAAANSVFKKFSKTKVILGVVDIARSRMESIEEVRARLLKALEHIDRERLIAGPDCGLGFFTREQAINKMKIMSEAADSI